MPTFSTENQARNGDIAVGRPRTEFSPTAIGTLLETLSRRGIARTDTEFARVLNASPRTIRAWRSGAKHPRIEHMFDLSCEASRLLGYEVTIDSLIRESRIRRQEKESRGSVPLTPPQKNFTC